MAVLIDPPLWPAHGRRWSHLASDASLVELHAFAARAGIPERGFEGDHYDVPEERYADTVAAGAMPVSSRELLRRLQDSGLRRPKRRGEKVLLSGRPFASRRTAAKRRAGSLATTSPVPASVSRSQSQAPVAGAPGTRAQRCAASATFTPRPGRAAATAVRPAWRASSSAAVCSTGWPWRG